ncbi:hypothetical protein NDU88_007476 [Pleurodeles waltl]|uniref:Uncharacterized protein n=1 Tax=Pleurodeles waltl TaxID=8319 RepID=A0AAV7RS11_PLEWA|nr:hypothetical protein NDU88_007476 [Pleurodeles waltl]
MARQPPPPPAPGPRRQHRVKCSQRGPSRALAYRLKHHSGPCPPSKLAVCSVSLGCCPSRGPPVLPGPLRFLRARERPRATHTSRGPVPGSDRQSWPSSSTVGLSPSGALRSPPGSSSRWQLPGSGVSPSGRISRGLPADFGRLTTPGSGSLPHTRSRLQAWGRAASLSSSRQPGLRCYTLWG